ncbi:peptidoglycan binding protein CsiV [Pseudomonas sp. KU26590]|uniref:CsiV family protein n=1 Tax=Pseudomonas sp. KU26590 TaxID=2991051 RepID=UPI00223CA843|nr:CsiV family protein [Pseudomonas sp. KU26590]UZJ62266.1 peptidoglycan binding protein CsiV [Pseudomonas sp. KU26590]
MRLLRFFTLLLVLFAPTAFADGTYQVELILFRQNGEPAATNQPAPEDWAAGAQRLGADSQTPTALDTLVTKLESSDGYKVLLHKAWQQDLSATPSKVAISDGQEQFGHFPIEGTVSLGLARFTDIDANIWVNQLDSHGVLVTSERMRQATRVRNGELTYMDNGSLAMLIKVSPVQPAR